MGLSREEIVQLTYTKDNFTALELRTMISQMKSYKLMRDHSIIKVEDICRVNTLNHPGLVIKVTKDLIYLVILTTEESFIGNRGQCQSRFLPNSYWTSTIVPLSHQDAIKNTQGLYDNHKHVREIKKQLRSYYKNLL